MLRFKRLCTSVGMTMCIMAPAMAESQTKFPEKPVRIVVSFTPGGAADLTARIVAEKLTERWNGQAVVVENITGAGGNVGALTVSRAAPDGYTLLLVSNTHAINRVLYPKTPIDITKDFQPIAMMSSSAIVIAVNPKSKINSLADLVDRMGQEKGQMNYLTCGVATAHHFSMELIKEAVKQNAVHIPQRGCGPAVVDATAGHADVVIATMPATLPFLSSGKLKAIAVTSKQRSDSAKDIPTVSESGIPTLKDFAVENYYGLAAPVGTPQDILTKIERDVKDILSNPELKKKFASAGLDGFYLSSAKSKELLLQDVEGYRKAAQSAGMKPE